MEQRKDLPVARFRPIFTNYRLGLIAALILPALVGLLSAPHATIAQERFEGQWLVEFRADKEKVQLTLRYREEKEGRREDNSLSSWNWNSSSAIDPAELHGLTREQAMSPSGTNVRFQIKRDAGTLDCEGWVRQGSGSGHFVFNPNPAFAAELRKQGIGEPTPKQLFSLAVSNLGFAFLEELRAQGYERPHVEQLVRMAHHGVRLEYLRGLKAFGYQVKTIDALVRMRDHGVTVSFIKELKALGYMNLTVEQLVRMRDHGVTASFVRRVKDERGTVPTVEELIRIKNHGEWN